jgi:hypothetical protein
MQQKLTHYSQQLWEDYEYLKKTYEKPNNSCQHNIMYSYSKDIAYKPYCNQFNCPTCRPRLLQKLKPKFTNQAIKNNLRVMITLTVKGKEFRKETNYIDSYKYMSKKWDILKKRINRKLKTNIDYICFVRSQKSGYCHLHILVNKYIAKSWLKKTAEELDLGFCNVKHVDIHNVIGYVNSYFTRNIQEWYIPPNIRHYNMSKSIKIRDKKIKSDWEYLRTPEERKRKINDVDYLHNHILTWHNKRIFGNNVVIGYSKPPPFDFMVVEFYKKLQYEKT